MKHAFYYLFFAVVLFSSCNKEKLPVDETSEKKCRIVSADMVFNPEKKTDAAYYTGSAIVNYDEKSNIKSIISTQDSAFRSFSVLFTATQLTLKTKYNGDWIYKLDGQGRVIYVEFYNGAIKANLAYNADGYLSSLIKTDSYSGSQMSYTFNYADGNLIKATGVNSLNGNTETLEYTYTNDIAIDLTSNANPLYYLEINEVIPGFFGKTSKNQLSSVKQTSMSKNYGSGYSFSYSFLHTRDSEGKITSMKIGTIYAEINPGVPNYIRGSWNSVYNFKYQCD
ncbi:hypothetical protein [Pedobacter punctiformis]|uniref:DUF4595 domain-containing protein n=1 Tax=Pedobacter punctiformis TaxID=3004097 RepID=A0ABT4L4L4_9SPHI|nr:hypothetical protein [Pedobacter sp. HCMS5-2]MCZ4242851.1 hypothetical protein [Pedobacter sp. HCMS5-2]